MINEDEYPSLNQTVMDAAFDAETLKHQQGAGTPSYSYSYDIPLRDSFSCADAQAQLGWDDRELRQRAIEAAVRLNPVDHDELVKAAGSIYRFLKGGQDDG